MPRAARVHGRRAAAGGPVPRPAFARDAAQRDGRHPRRDRAWHDRRRPRHAQRDRDVVHARQRARAFLRRAAAAARAAHARATSREMTAMEKKEADALTNDLAIRIYVELIGRNTQITESGVKMNSSAANIAALSLRLADAFLKADEEATAAKAPVTTYKLDGKDIAAWTK